MRKPLHVKQHYVQEMFEVRLTRRVDEKIQAKIHRHHCTNS